MARGVRLHHGADGAARVGARDLRAHGGEVRGEAAVREQQVQEEVARRTHAAEDLAPEVRRRSESCA